MKQTRSAIRASGFFRCSFDVGETGSPSPGRCVLLASVYRAPRGIVKSCATLQRFQRKELSARIRRFRLSRRGIAAFGATRSDPALAPDQSPNDLPASPSCACDDDNCDEEMLNAK